MKKERGPSELPDLRAMTLKALLKVGGVEYLAQQALANPGNFLLLLGKVMPKEVHTELTAEVKIRQEVRRDLIDTLLGRILEEERRKEAARTIEHQSELPMLQAQKMQDAELLSHRQSCNRREAHEGVAGSVQRASAMMAEDRLSASVDASTHSALQRSGDAQTQCPEAA